MKQRYTHLGAVWVLILAAITTGGYARGQDAVGGQDARPGSRGGFAGGQMVRGTVTSAAPDHLTVKTETGEIFQVVTTENTRVMKDRQPAKLTDIKAGDGVGAGGTMDAATRTVHAAVVMVVDAEQVRKAQENLGKTYIAGKLTAIDELKLTVQRPDGVSQVIEVDEGTSFRKGGRGAMGAGGLSPSPGTGGGAGTAGSAGESITLADIKVGDSLIGQGAVKHGVFVATELRVADPSQRQRRRAPNASPAAPPTDGPR